MAITIKSLITKNKTAFDAKCFIESLSLSYILINKALKQILKDDFNLEFEDNKIKTTALVSQIKEELTKAPNLKVKISKKLIKDVDLFLKLYKSIHKELKFQFPEKKIEETANLGISCIVILNTSLIKIKNKTRDLLIPIY